ncbi:hypothetical protein GBA63_18525 [Rubrobacter tropicus]|uniref:Uncharacterized protein n=1 Tax=Rubrobacter tropicus TaxID=2653851 RepID=A0A6G8QDA0_9ACTN|nr:hypothetical protein [Rubrobacter tropicus]QIN84412.1 hypothetical protein GBA63_18525 [Rubrobacter tropicus]
MIDWSRLEPGQRDKTGRFEELCYQVEKGVYGSEARFVSVDDSGGGDGVEFYATFPDETQWGWQAKFFFPDTRLTPGRKAQIKKSLQRACDVHPDLTKWFLCVPGELTTTERKWFEERLPGSILGGRTVVPEGRSVTLEFLGHQYLSDKLSEERFAGKRRYFFGELELSVQWFRGQFEKQLRGVRDKYERPLHTETHDEVLVHALLADDAFGDDLDRRLGVLRQDLADYDRRVEELAAGIPRQVEFGDVRGGLLKAVRDMRPALEGLLDRLSEIREHVRRGELDLVRQGAHDLPLESLLVELSAYQNVRDKIDVASLGYSGPPDHEEDYKLRAERTLGGPWNYAAEIHDGARRIRSLLDYLNKPDLHALGDPGQGKTHLACWICDERIDKGLPAIFLPGKNFVGEGSFETQLRELLDLPPSYGWNDFVGALEAAAEAHRTRIPIVIDGLNEAVRNGRFSTVWERHLPGLVAEISKAPEVTLITTSRSSYRDAIWPNEGGVPENAIFVDGFGFDGVDEAIDRYFAAYKIRADLTATPLDQFAHPIYLKLFCEAKNPKRREWVDVQVGEETLFEIFDQYLRRCDAEAARRLELRRGTPVVSQALQRLAAHLWLHGGRFVPIREAARLVDGAELEHLVWDVSRTNAMESEGLVVCRDLLGEGEAYLITYDLMAGYLIARHIIGQNDDLKGFLNSNRAVELLYGSDFSQRHPLHEDIRRSLAALAPGLKGRHLHELTDNEVAVSDSVRALFEISAEHVGESSVRLVAERFGQEARRRELLSLSYPIIVRPGHPLNADFWHEQLKRLPLPERDLSWSEHLRTTQGLAAQLIRLLEARCSKTDEAPAELADRLRLTAEYAMWTLTSTVRDLRDRATRALYWYGRRFPEEFFTLVEGSFEIDDPCVSERMLAACYGVAMARRYDPADRGFVEGTLLRWAEKLYAAMFAVGAPHATTHILARNYARRTIEIAALHHPDVFTDERLGRTRPPYRDGGLRDWGQSEDRNEGGYRGGGSPFNPLEDDPMGQLGRGISKYHSGAPEYRTAKANLWWRVYDLGYSFDAFGPVDARINREASYARRYDDGRGWAEGYGRKYVRVATRELAGHRDDLGLLREEGDWEVNPSHVDIDPSFPERPPELLLVPGDLLGDRREPLGDWISRGPNFAFKDVLEVETLDGERGPWVLLWGHVTQHDEKHRRYMFCFMQGLLLEAADADEILGAVNGAEENRLDATDIPEIHYAYAGEIPWCETYPSTEPSEIALILGETTVATKKVEIEFVRDGESVSDAEVTRLMSHCLGDEDDVSETQDDDEAAVREFGRALQERGIELLEREVTVNERRLDMESRQMTMPVNRHRFSGGRSDVTPDFSPCVPARQIADDLGLTNRPQTYDLFASDGRRASLSFAHGEGLSDMQEFTFIRKDHLDRYLNGSGQRLAWAIYGERAFYDGGMGEAEALLGDAPPYVRYEKTRLYD